MRPVAGRAHSIIFVVPPAGDATQKVLAHCLLAIGKAKRVPDAPRLDLTLFNSDGARREDGRFDVNGAFVHDQREVEGAGESELRE